MDDKTVADLSEKVVAGVTPAKQSRSQKTLARIEDAARDLLNGGTWD